MIETRRRSGYLRALHRGVYAVGHVALAAFGSELAAVLACSPNAWLSHHAAARLWGVIEASTVPEVTVVGRNCGSKEGIVVHRAATLPAIDRTRREGIPVTSVARTLVDLAPSLSPRQLERAFDEGRVRSVISPAAVKDALARYPRCRGAVALTSLLDEERATTITRADSEERMLALIRRAGLPAPSSATAKRTTPCARCGSSCCGSLTASSCTSARPRSRGWPQPSPTPLSARGAR